MSAKRCDHRSLGDGWEDASDTPGIGVPGCFGPLPHEAACCQFCGRLASAGTDGWLVARHRRARDIWIIRCPDHINHWALYATGQRRFRKRWIVF